jgi:deoxyribonuclease IV
MALLGAHMSISGGLEKALLRGRACGCQVIQLFTANPNQWVARKLTSREIDAFHAVREETSVVPVAAHDSYLINLASPRPDNRRRSAKALENEMERADRLNIPYVVIHPGAHLDHGETAGIQRISESLNRIFDRTAALRTCILLETTAGQGTTLGYRFEHLSEIIQQTACQERLGICLDTCHIFAAGHAFGERKSFNKLIRDVDRMIGWERLKLIHINDSKRPQGSRVDRHEHIGRGYIGERAFTLFLKAACFRDLPFILETPKGTDASGTDLDIRNLTLLKQLMEG